VKRKSLTLASREVDIEIKGIVYYGLPFEGDEMGFSYCHCRPVIYVNLLQLFIDDYYLLYCVFGNLLLLSKYICICQHLAAIMISKTSHSFLGKVIIP